MTYRYCIKLTQRLLINRLLEKFDFIKVLVDYFWADKIHFTYFGLSLYYLSIYFIAIFHFLPSTSTLLSDSDSQILAEVLPLSWHNLKVL